MQYFFMRILRIYYKKKTSQKLLFLLAVISTELSTASLVCMASYPQVEKSP